MTGKKPGLLLILILLFLNNSFGQKKIIFDTDFGGDADDLGALAMLNHFIDKGECDLLAVMSCSTEESTIPAIHAVNTFYNHPEIPLGIFKNHSFVSDWTYSKPIAEQFPHTMKMEDAADATVLYRQILSGSADNSITLITVGPLINIQNLIKSGPDSISELNGKELIHKKVKEFVVMGGQFPSGENEWNFNGDRPGVTRFVIENIDLPITFSGYEVGYAIRTGETFNETDHNSPLYVGFLYFSEHAPWIKENFKGKILDNATYDQTAVLYALKNGVGKYWEKVENGICVPDDHGGNTWEPAGHSNHSYLKLIMEPEKLASIIESMMLNKF